MPVAGAVDEHDDVAFSFHADKARIIVLQRKCLRRVAGLSRLRSLCDVK